METRICTKCGQTKNIETFNIKVKAQGIRQRYCRECTRLQVRTHYKNNQDYYIRKARKRNNEVRKQNQQNILTYLASHPCVDCGETDLICLDFDHVRGEKKKAIAVMIRSCEWKRVEQEISKCEVRCAHCHRRKTSRDRGYFRFLGLVLRP